MDAGNSGDDGNHHSGDHQYKMEIKAIEIRMKVMKNGDQRKKAPAHGAEGAGGRPGQGPQAAEQGRACAAPG